jgi:Eco57I restriction-modification methylase
MPRRRFDFVVGNPPYISYNECAGAGLKSFALMKSGGLSLADVYGWNLHSAPGRQKKYPPKPNLYAFFVALGFALLKKGGRFCYIIPQTLLTESDYDVLRHKLSQSYTIEKLITFAGHLFVGRGTSQGRKIATSSLIIVCGEGIARNDHQVECVHVPERELDVRDVFAEMRSNRKTYSKTISQGMLRANVDNWAFITWAPAVIAAYAAYKASSEPMALYSQHTLAEARFKHRFYFDVGYILDPEAVTESPPSGQTYIPLADFKDFTNFTNFRPRAFYPWSEKKIRLPKTSQGYEVLKQKYKILWEKSRKAKFYFTDSDVLPSMSFCQIIASDNRDEMLFLFALLNSAITRGMYRAMFKLQSEKHGMFVVVRRIKEFVRPPLIDSAERGAIKERITRLAEQALAMEFGTVGKVVKLDTMRQKFRDVAVQGGALVLDAGPRELRIPIAPAHRDRVAEGVQAYFGDRVKDSRAITLNELLTLPIVDCEAQAALFERIDELFVDLYRLKKSDWKCLRELALAE